MSTESYDNNRKSFHYEYHELNSCHFNPLAEEIDDRLSTLEIIRLLNYKLNNMRR